MKKFKAIFLWVCMVCVGTVLCACNFKDPVVSFTKTEIVLSVGDEVDLNEILEVENLQKDKIVFKVSNPALVKMEGSKATAFLGGTTFVYACTNDNVLATSQVIVKKPFYAPENIKLSGNVLSWDAVSDVFDGQNQVSVATSYTVSGTVEKPNQQAKSFKETVSGTSIVLQESGIYKLSVSANAQGYFDIGMQSSLQTFYVGYMPKLTKENFAFEDGVLSWQADELENASFEVRVNGQFIASTTQKQVDLTALLEKSQSTSFRASVKVLDITEDESKKLDQTSEDIVITKLAKPNIRVQNGRMEISSSANTKKYIAFKGNQKIQIACVNGVAQTMLDELDAGAHNLEIRSYGEGFVFHSNAQEVEVVKLEQPILSATGGNDFNSTTSNAFATSIAQSQDVVFEIYGLSETPMVSGEVLQAGQTECRLNLKVLNAGKFNVQIRAKATDANANFLCSKPSDSLEITKMPQFDGEITHRLVNKKSELVFDKVSDDAVYGVQMFDGQNFVDVSSDKYTVNVADKVTIAFTQDVLNENKESFTFMVYATTQNQKQTIASAKTKQLSVLPAPQLVQSGKEFSWQRVSGVKSYQVQVYLLTKAQYQALGQGDDSVLNGLGFESIKTEETKISLETEGYYAVQVFAQTADENRFISSKNCLQSAFIITKQLSLGDVKFGFDLDRINQDSTGASGYFVDIDASDNVTNYNLTIGSATENFVAQKNKTPHNLTETFKTSKQISIIAKGEDDAIYLPSEAYSFNVTKLKSVAAEDLQVSAQGNLSGKLAIADFKENATLQYIGQTGTQSIRVERINTADTDFATGTDSVVYKIKDLPSFTLQFAVKGSVYDELFKTYEIKNGQVYISPESSTIDFVRMQQPTDLAFENNQISFKHQDAADAQYYVLNINCTAANGASFVASVRLASSVVAVFDGQSFNLGSQSQFVSVSETISINLAEILQSLKQNSAFSQAKIVDFSVYAYAAKQVSGTQQILLSSDFATTLQGDKSIAVSAIAAPELTFSQTSTEYVLNIKQTSQILADYAADTTFDVYDGTAKVATISGSASVTTYAFVKDLLNHDLYVVAQNPHYLSSATSNHVKLNKLKAVQNLSLTKNGTLVFATDANDALHCQVKLFVDDVEEQTISLDGNLGSITISDFGVGQYSLQLLANPSETLQDGTICAYIDSQISTWTLQQLSAIAPSSLSVGVENGNITWQALSQPTVNGLEYNVVFKGQGGIVQYTVQTNQLNWQTDEKLRESLQGLSAGDVEISVSAHIKPYTAVVGGTIYFANRQALLSGNQEYNHLLYTNKTIKKLSAPRIESVVFVNANGSAFTAEPFAITNLPNALITISGNYGTSAGDETTFLIYRDGTTEPLHTITLQRDANGMYQFQILAADYNALLATDESLVFKIYAVPTGNNASDIASSYGQVVLNRAQTIEGVSFEEDDLGYTHNLVLTLNKDYLNQVVGGETENGINGGIVLEIVINDGETERSTFKLITLTGATTAQVEYDLTSVLSTLKAGGTVQVKAYVNSSSIGDNIFVASDITSSVIYNILSQPNSVSNADYGIRFNNNGDDDLVFVVVHNGEKYQVNSSNNFKFVVPVEWADGTYLLQVYTKKADCLASAIFNYTLNLSRIDAVQNIVLARLSNNLITISWDEVSGAAGYIVNVYKNDNGNRGALLASVDADKTSYTLTELFGDFYENLVGDGKFDLQELTSASPNSALKLRLEVITKGGSAKNNSVAKVQNLFVETNPTTTQSFGVDEFGNVVFNGQEDKKYLYRFVSHNGENLINEAGENLSVWKEVFGNVLDASKIEYSGLAFNVQVLAMGNLDTAVPTVDSVVFSSLSQDLNYFKLNGISQISVSQVGGGSLALTSPTAQFTHIYLGVNANDLLQSNVMAVNVFDIQPGADNNEFILYITLADVLNYLSSKALSGQVEVYLWIQQASNAPTLYVASMPKTYSVQVSNDPGFVGLVKGDSVTEEVDGVSTTYTNLTNTYATFKTELFTIGFFVKISQGSFSTTKFVSVDDAVNKNGKSAINLTALFEEGSLKNLSGNFEIDFARVKINLSGTPVISNWHSVSNQQVSVLRLDSVPAVNMQNGNLMWENILADVTKYYLYFYTNLEGDQFTYVALNPQDINTFNASSFAGTDGKYYIAVQAVSDKQNVISSNKVFKLDDAGLPQLIYKNQIKSLLKLADGMLYMDWTFDEEEGNFVSTLMAGNDYTQTILNLTTKTFTSPFTFTLSDLVDGKVKLRLRFVKQGDAVGNGITVDVDILDVMADLFKQYQQFKPDQGDVLERLNVLIEKATQLSDQKLLTNLKDKLQKSSYGIANQRKLFDEYFESIQTGAYTLEYCLIEGNKTLNSQWYNFDNVNNENVVYVNAQPNINVNISRKTSLPENVFMVLIEKSNIWQYTDGQYILQTAENYVVKIGERTFAIGGGMLTQLDGEEGSVTVYERDAQGGTTDTTHLMFYLNYNKGDSFLGVFGDSFVGDQRFEIYAVGNNHSLSSKSEFYKINFLQFSNIQVVDGAFVWTTYQGRQTTVGTKLLGEESTYTYTYVDGSRETAQFALDNKMYGRYSIEMIMEGEIRGNMIIVDSNVLCLPEVYKLQQPSLSNTKGYLGIQATQSATDSLKNAYSEGDFRYVIYNNVSGASSFKTIAYDDQQAVLLYETGTTKLSETDPDWAYKRTEISASQFSVGMMGSSCKLSFTDADEYYKKLVVCVDAQGQQVTGNVALKSTFSKISAAMMDAVSAIKVQDGVISWDAARGCSVSGQNLVADGEVVYKVVVSKYIETYTSSGMSQSEIKESVNYYTRLTTFDMAMVEKTEQDTLQNIKYKVSVQALALEISEEDVFVDKVQLVEGGYGFGNVKYQNSEIFVLMGNVGNYSTLDGIVRLNSVSNLHVENGSLVWQFTAEGQNLQTLQNYYNFVVADDSNKEIAGTCQITQQGDVFNVVFTEAAGQMPSGQYNLNVFVTAGRNNTAKAIKSYAQTIEITKLQTVLEEDVEISTFNLESAIEVLNLKGYFDKFEENKVVATFDFGQSNKTFTFTKDRYKLYILNQGLLPGQSLPYDNVVLDENNNGFIIVGAKETVVATFKANSSKANAIYSDASLPFSLHRIEWSEEDIAYNQQEGKFSWNYDATDGQQVVYVVTASYIYTNSQNQTVQEMRTYTATDSFFKPTIIGKVQISVRIKASKSNILSEAKQSQLYDFNLFKSGSGENAENAYIIADEAQFENIKYRLTKDEMLNSYISGNTQIQDENKVFYFALAKDLNLNIADAESGQTSYMVNGILFKGTFDGVLDCGGHSLSFTSTGVSKLENAVQIARADTAMSLSNAPADQGLNFGYGSALFESLSENATIKNLNISVCFGVRGTGEDAYTKINFHALMAGLCITSAGHIENVSVTAFENNFYGNLTTRAVMVYSGIVSKNSITGSLRGCSNTANMLVNDFNHAQLIFVSGIAYTNYGVVQNCTSGALNSTLQVVCNANIDSIQMAGVCITNVGEIFDCQNLYNLRCNGSGSDVVCYMAGIVVLTRNGQLSVSQDANLGRLDAESNITVQKGNIYTFA